MLCGTSINNFNKFPILNSDIFYQIDKKLNSKMCQFLIPNKSFSLEDSNMLQWNNYYYHSVQISDKYRIVLFFKWSDIKIFATISIDLFSVVLFQCFICIYDISPWKDYLLVA